MDAHRFDALSKKLAAGLPRRRLFRRAGAVGLAAAIGVRRGTRPAFARTSSGTVSTGVCGCMFCGNLDCDCRFTPEGEMTCAFKCVSCNPFGGVAGGGQVRLASGEATLALVATAVHDEAGEPTGQGIGLLRWVDAGGSVTLESVGIGEYGPVGDLVGVRRVTGFVMANAAGPYPFELIVTDVGPDGSGADTLSIVVGDAIEGESGHGFSYTANGNLAIGDLVGTWTLPVPPQATPTA